MKKYAAPEAYLQHFSLIQRSSARTFHFVFFFTLGYGDKKLVFCQVSPTT